MGFGRAPRQVRRPRLLPQIPGGGGGQIVEVAGQGVGGHRVALRCRNPGRGQGFGGEPHRLLKQLQRAPALIGEGGLRQLGQPLRQPRPAPPDRLLQTCPQQLRPQRLLRTSRPNRPGQPLLHPGTDTRLVGGSESRPHRRRRLPAAHPVNTCTVIKPSGPSHTAIPTRTRRESSIVSRWEGESNRPW